MKTLIFDIRHRTLAGVITLILAYLSLLGQRIRLTPKDRTCGL